jgi:hypothetical protein
MAAAQGGGVIDLSSVIYDVDPVVLVPVGLLITVLTASLPKSRRLSARDSLVAFWYLFNGIVIHIFLDGYDVRHTIPPPPKLGSWRRASD